MLSTARINKQNFNPNGIEKTSSSVNILTSMYLKEDSNTRGSLKN
jgi:hypothetical protein